MTLDKFNMAIGMILFQNYFYNTCIYISGNF